jgi:HEAT repeat protein
MPSAQFDRFVATVNAPIRFRRDDIDGFAIGIGLHLLTGEERVQGEDLLIGKLGTDDGRFANALAEVGCTRAIPALAERAAASASPAMRLFAARALLALGDDSGRSAMADLLRTGAGDRHDRAAAVTLLAEFPDPDMDLIWDTAVAEPHESVRSSATAALIGLHGLADYNTSYRDVLGGIHARMFSPLRSVREDAMSDLRAVLARRAAGETPQQLGLTWQADDQTEPVKSFIDSIHNEDPPWAQCYAIDGLSALPGPGRRWVEDMLLGLLHRDRRAARAVAVLRVRRAIGPLRELLETADGAIATQATAALRQLTDQDTT